MDNSLDPSLRRALKKQAHHLRPIVQSGAAGLSDAVIAEIDRALQDHELVKIKLASEDRHVFNNEVARVCAALEAACIQKIGRTATIYRQNPDADKHRDAANTQR